MVRWCYMALLILTRQEMEGTRRVLLVVVQFGFKFDILVQKKQVAVALSSEKVEHMAANDTSYEAI
jgi:hypothetical protein